MVWIVGALFVFFIVAVLVVIFRFDSIESSLSRRPTDGELRRALDASERYCRDLYQLHENTYQHRRKPKAKK